MSHPVHIVWFKRDLRVHDHAPLAEAARRGRVVPLYVIEPGLWAQPDASGRHWAFLRESLIELRAALTALGAPLVVRVGEMTSVLEAFHAQAPGFTLWSHEETGNGWTYARDRSVAEWCRAHAVVWEERRQNGVIRRLARRDGWARRWETFMAEPLAAPPGTLSNLSGIEPGEIPEYPPGLADDPCPDRQVGGRQAAEAVLASFLDHRGLAYHRALSSPLTAEDQGSRLSAHLAWGTLSLREVTQAGQARLQRLREAPEAPAGSVRALRAFLGRLHWHCHFIQKLESEPRLEFENTHPAYDGLREPEFDAARFEAWCAGRTGWPFVDACQRYLAHTGWINFRMRAMLMAVASYHLWLHWRAPALFLARRFTDYEPGIHYPQAQMQSGVTGINTVRIYNPVKQGLDQDPEGVFIRRWVPELRAVPTPALHTPWMLDAGTREALCPDYPLPLLDHADAARSARERIWAIRRGAAFHRTADAIQDRHGSRKAGLPPTARPRKPRVATPQLPLSFDP